MYLTGMVEKRTLEKYEREAKEKNRETWYLSWALDTNLEGQFINIFARIRFLSCS
jgi:peptide chain release factor subunit 3